MNTFNKSSNIYHIYVKIIIIIFVLNILPVYLDISNINYMVEHSVWLLFSVIIPYISHLFCFFIIVIYVYKIENKIKEIKDNSCDNLMIINNNITFLARNNLIFISLYVIIYSFLIFLALSEKYYYYNRPATLFEMNIFVMYLYLYLKYMLLLHKDNNFKLLLINLINLQMYLKILILSYISSAILLVFIPIIMFNANMQFVYYFSILFSPYILYTTILLFIFNMIILIFYRINTIKADTPAIINKSKNQFYKEIIRGLSFLIILVIIVYFADIQYNKNFIKLVNNNNVPAATVYLLNDADIEAKDDNDETPLLTTVRNNKTEMTHLLLYFGADSDVTNRENQTPLHLAVILKNIDITRYILWMTNKINALDIYGFATIHYAVTNRSMDIISFLINNGADVNIHAEKTGNTPLHIACSQGHLQIVSILLSAGADINSIDGNKQTPIYKAIINNNHPDVVSYLVDHGADINKKDTYGLTVLDYAKRYRNNEVIEVLEKQTVKK